MDHLAAQKPGGYGGGFNAPTSFQAPPSSYQAPPMGGSPYGAPMGGNPYGAQDHQNITYNAPPVGYVPPPVNRPFGDSRRSSYNEFQVRNQLQKEHMYSENQRRNRRGPRVASPPNHGRMAGKHSGADLNKPTKFYGGKFDRQPQEPRGKMKVGPKQRFHRQVSLDQGASPYIITPYGDDFNVDPHPVIRENKQPTYPRGCNAPWGDDRDNQYLPTPPSAKHAPFAVGTALIGNEHIEFVKQGRKYIGDIPGADPNYDIHNPPPEPQSKSRNTEGHKHTPIFRDDYPVEPINRGRKKAPPPPSQFSIEHQGGYGRPIK